MFNHGKRLRLNYGSLITNQWYSTLNMNVRSSVLERCSMTAASILAAFLPPPLPNLPIIWQPVAITTLSANEDNMLAASAPCPKYSQLFNNFITNPPPEIQAFLQENFNFYNNLTQLSGMSVHNVMDAFTLYNIIEVQRDNGLPIPPWGAQLLNYAKPFYLAGFNIFTQTDYMKKAQFGALITDIVGNFQRIAAGNQTYKRNILQYSGHDTTILGMTRLLNIKDQVPGITGYGATLTLELLYSKSVGYQVIANYWKSATTLKPTNLNFPNCKSPCSLVRFIAAYSSFMIVPPETFASICALSGSRLGAEYD